MSKPIIIKVITAGEGGVGKTTLLHRYIDDVFLEDTKMTIGVEFFTKDLVINGRNISLQLWDLGGQDRFRFLQKSYAKGAKGALLMFDLTRFQSLERIDQWIEICRTSDPDLPILFVGTKWDLKDQIQIDDEYAKEIQQEHGFFDYIKVSSLTDENVDEAVEKLVKKILERINSY
ncbi:MAG: Rab family GTPase [Promethearchaeia archaeon]